MRVPVGNVVSEKFVGCRGVCISSLYQSSNCQAPSCIIEKDHIFEKCENIRTVWIPQNGSGYEIEALKEFSNVESFYVEAGNESFAAPDGVLYHKKDKCLVAFPHRKTGSYQIAAGTLSIGEAAFALCKELTAVTLPDGIQEIGTGAFWACHGLKKLNLPGSLRKIGSYAFHLCVALEAAEIPDGISEIENGVFYVCKNMKSLTIPRSVRQIGERAFCSCESLSSVTVPDSVTEIGKAAFDKVPHIIYNGSARSDDNWGAQKIN